MKHKKPVFFFVIVICIFFVSRYIISLLSPDDKMGSVAEVDMPSEASENVQAFSIYSYSDEGGNQWQVEGKSADILATTIHLFDINGKMFGDKANVEITADRGVFEKDTNNVQLESNVVVITDEGTRLVTDKMTWDAQAELIDNNEHVLIERDDMVINGFGASVKPDMKTARLKKNITVTVNDPEAVITCDGPLDVDYSNNISYFNNKVLVDDGKVQIYADKAKALFDPKERTLIEVVSEGNVKIVKGENITHAEKMTYLPKEGRVILTGRPKIVIVPTEDISGK